MESMARESMFKGCSVDASSVVGSSEEVLFTDVAGEVADEVICAGKGDSTQKDEWAYCDALLKERIALNRQLHRSTRRKVSEILKEVAKETGRSFRGVQMRYYTVVRRQLLAEGEGEKRQEREKGDVVALADVAKERKSTEEETEGKNAEIKNSEREDELSELPLELPRVGDIVTVRVTNVIDYGVFAQAEGGYQGFIRVGEVTREEWLSGRSDLERYFYPGEVVRVKVVAISDGKVYFSCKALGGKKPHGLLPLNGQALKISRGSSLDKELQELVHLLSLRVGKVSDKAREGLGELMLTHGVVRVTSRLFELLEDWDQSLGIVKELKEVLDGEYNRVV